jgi:hypothetical protein
MLIAAASTLNPSHIGVPLVKRGQKLAFKALRRGTIADAVIYEALWEIVRGPSGALSLD